MCPFSTEQYDHAVAISAPNRSLKIKPYLARKPIDSNAFPNLYMPVLPNCSRYGYFLISLKSYQTSLRCSLPDYYITHAASSVLLTQAKSSTPQSQISS